MNNKKKMVFYRSCFYWKLRRDTFWLANPSLR